MAGGLDGESVGLEVLLLSVPVPLVDFVVGEADLLGEHGDVGLVPVLAFGLLVLLLEEVELFLGQLPSVPDDHFFMRLLDGLLVGFVFGDLEDLVHQGVVIGASDHGLGRAEHAVGVRVHLSLFVGLGEVGAALVVVDLFGNLDRLSRENGAEVVLEVEVGVLDAVEQIVLAGEVVHDEGEGGVREDVLLLIQARLAKIDVVVED